ncbi:VPA1262 family N-terminal domain-containing protein [Acinetobacter oleivorans]|uniref:VPA1262 family N-terminal domain-containing protein n=1 Tax=Acinetobacter oleivorans TaxID=1148157 RepID=UPI003015B310
MKSTITIEPQFSEKDKFDLYYKDMEYLLQPHILGFFNCIEIIEIGLLIDKSIVNALTIAVATDKKNFEFDSDQYLTSGLVKIKYKNYKFGIKKYYKSIESFILNIRNLTDKSIWTMSNDEKNHCTVPPLKLENKKFVAPNNFDEVPINSLLKNNFFNGSYIYEWVNTTKDELKFLLENPSVLQDLSSKIQQNNLPIQLSELSDKIGNYIFQIPANIFSSNFYRDKNTRELHCEIAWHPNTTPRPLAIICENPQDDELLEQKNVVLTSSDSNDFIIPFNSDLPFIASIIDYNENLILSSTKPTSFINTIHLKTHVVGNYHSNRIRKYIDLDGTEIELILRIPEYETPIFDWTEQRIYKNDIEKSKADREFVQYKTLPTFSKNEAHKQALKDIHWLIDNYGQLAVWLWDPYLSHDDLKETLFQNSHLNSQMRAITALYSSSKSICTECHEILCSACKSQFSIESSEDLSQIKENFNQYDTVFKSSINLEFRTTRNANNGKFHDRFIIFPHTQQGTLAWSLGTSVNSFGKSHHILQKVTDGQMIADAFNEFWQSLQNEEYLIWRSEDEN